MHKILYNKYYSFFSGMSRRGNLQNVVSIIFKFAFCKLPGSVFRVLSGCFTLMINE